MFDKLCDNLNQLMEEVHISADELARRTGIPASTIKKIRNRYNPNPTLTTLIPLAKFFSISLSALVGDEPLPDKRIKGLHSNNSDIFIHLPIIEWKDALNWPIDGHSIRTMIATECKYSKNSYALLVEEDDWENLARGTALLIDPELKPMHRDYVIIHKNGQSAPSLKQILIDENDIYLKPVISGYNLTTFTPEHKILGVIVEYKKRLKA